MSTPITLTDSFGRHIDYLRVSITERCDLRCVYCHPPERKQDRDTLAATEVVTIVRAAASLGIKRVRLTGGEPLLREDLSEIIEGISALTGIEDLSLTTNGQLLAQQASKLARSGLRRVNVSVDSLDPKIYREITGGDLTPVLAGLEAAKEAGLDPLKINVVLSARPSLMLPQLQRFADFIATRPVHVRFIEAMPTCINQSYLPAKHVLNKLAELDELTPDTGPLGGGPARYYRLGRSRGTFGIINPLSEPFCNRCNRLRVNARGELIPCLFSTSGLPLVVALKRSDPIAALIGLLREAAALKPCRYLEVAAPSGINAMHAIGG